MSPKPRALLSFSFSTKVNQLLLLHLGFGKHVKLSTTSGNFYIGKLGFYECWCLQFKTCNQRELTKVSLREPLWSTEGNRGRKEVGKRGFANSCVTEFQILLHALHPWPTRDQREDLGEIKGEESPAHGGNITDLELCRGK